MCVLYRLARISRVLLRMDTLHTTRRSVFILCHNILLPKIISDRFVTLKVRYCTFCQWALAIFLSQKQAYLHFKVIT